MAEMKIPHERRWLSRDFSDLIRKQKQNKEIYDIVIVGSGYGGAMAAAKLAGAKNKEGQPISICVLERGKEYLPGSFPSQMAELPGHVRFTGPDAKEPTGNGDGLFDVRIGEDVCALLANGLGGGSLINAAVMAEPAWGTFDARLASSITEGLKKDYAEVKNLLGCVDKAMSHHPDVGANVLKKTMALQSLEPKSFHLADLTIEVAAQPKDRNLKKCTLCGDCMTGCNIGAKKSLDTNLLLTAHQAGAEIYTGASVLKLKRVAQDGSKQSASKPSCWEIDVVFSDEHRRSLHNSQTSESKGPIKLRAHKVILAAGAFGSPEILLRSQSRGLRFSARLGQQFSCNGDNIATFYKLKNEVNAVADETTPITDFTDQGRRVGPTITSMLDIKFDIKQNPTKQDFLIQEFSIPGPLKRLFEEVVTTSNTLYGITTADCSTHRPANSEGGELDPCAVDEKAIRHTALVGVIGHDAANGVLKLPESERRKKQYSGMIQVVWPDARRGKALADAMAYLNQLGIGKKGSSSPLETAGRVLPNPLWQMAPPDLAALFDHPKGPVLTVHPLGGCPIGTGIENGVVNDCGQVFDAMNQKKDADQDSAAMNEKKDAWQGSLIVLDGSIIPASIGANPALTIATLAYRACIKLAAEWKWTLKAEKRSDKTTDPGPRGSLRPPEACSPAKAQPTIIKISERLIGEVMMFPPGSVIPKKYIVELTLRYQEMEIRNLMTQLYRKIGTDSETQKPPSLLRIFDKDVWENKLKFAFSNETLRDKEALFIAPVSGTLTVFNRECSTGIGRVIRGGSAWFVNRGCRDLSQMALEKLRAKLVRHTPSTAAESGTWLSILRNTVKLASRSGEVRRLDYELNIGETIVARKALAKLKLGKAMICGEKRITYNLRANPLPQMTNLKLTQFPSMLPMTSAILKLDMRFMAIQEIPLAQITKQQNQVSALCDMASFGMYMARMMLTIHLWTFRKPDTPDERVPVRLPTTIPGLPAPEIIEIDLDTPRDGIPVRVRLTRYRGDRPDETLCPLVMIHGYSASGTTFAHHAIGTSMAKFFADRGRDVWILDLRTSAGMPTAALRWDFEDAALEDIPVAIAHILHVTGKTQVDVFAHCIGAVMLSMAILVDLKEIDTVLPLKIGERENDTRRRYVAELEALPKSIRRVILSEKGPALVYTDDNAVRAYLMRFLRQIALPDDYQFDIQKNQSIRDQLLDRFLNLLPYPPDEYDRENPFSLFNPAKRTPWVGFRHRMDALYARDFSVTNIPDSTLEYIADLFGPLNLDTVSQAIHFVRYDKITNAAGRSTFVNRANLQARWAKNAGTGIEYTMSIHGAENGLVDKETLKRMYRLMEDAGIPFKPHLVQGMGHQDTLIGSRNTEVFEAIEKFLNEKLPAQTVPKPNKCQWALPWLGPRFQARANQPDSIMVMADPAIGDAHGICIPVKKNGDAYEVVPIYVASIVAKKVLLGKWRELDVPAFDSQAPDWDGILVLLCYDEAILSMPAKSAKKAPLDIADLRNNFSCVIAQSTTAEIAAAYISKQELMQTTGRGEAKSELRFAVASCQYPVGLMDRPVAQRSLQKLADQLISNNKSPELLLLLGDQIYSDATGGLLDPTRTSDRYLRPHEDWLRMPPLRTVMRKIPVYCMLDDHEIIDNWDPKKVNEYNWYKDQGRAAYLSYQPSPRQPDNTNLNNLWVSFIHNGFPFFMADSRSKRTPRPLDRTTLALGGKPPDILGAEQTEVLQKWLKDCKSKDCKSKDCKSARPKIISTASMLLPRHVAHDSDRESLDGWDGFPDSLHRLLAFIFENNLTGVVFLSGDEHTSCVAKITVRAKPAAGETCDKSVSILSIHSSGLYAPLPFANALPEDLREEEEFPFEVGGKNYICRTETSKIDKGDGYAMLNLTEKENRWQLTLEFEGRDGLWGPQIFDLG